MSIQLMYAAQSHVGLVRKNNQDSGYAGPHLLVLADGMGGPAGGDIASSVAVAHLAALDADSHRADDLLGLLRQAINGAHEELIERSTNHKELVGLGTTCIAILRSGHKMAMVHIGDSRAYLLRNKQLTQVTTDHSFVQYLVQTGELTKEQAENHPQRSVLTRVLGDMNSEVHLDESVREAVLGDRWLLCSDGLSGVVSFDTISDVLSTVSSPKECCSQLIELALRAGGPDNITCVVADVVDSEEHLGDTVAQIVGSAGTGQGSSLIKGHSPAHKAAALRNAQKLKDSSTSASKDTKGEIADPRLLSMKAKAIIVGGVVTLICFLSILIGKGYSWTQQQKFLGVNNGYVTVFKGINQHFGSWKLYEPLQQTDVSVKDLIPAVRERLDKTVTVYSVEEAKRLIKTWQDISQELDDQVDDSSNGASTITSPKVKESDDTQKKTTPPGGEQ